MKRLPITYKYETMAFEDIEIHNSNGERLQAQLELPANKKAVAFALFAHCFTCSSDLRVVRYISRELTHFGFGVLRFDFTGLGQSEGNFSDTNFSHNLADLREVNSWLAKHYRAPSLLIGHSLGGAAALMAAAELDNVKAVATIGAPADTEHVTHLFAGGETELERKGQAEVSIGGRPFVIKKQFIEDLRKHELKEVLSAMRKPVLIMHSPQDTVVGIDNAARLYHAAHHPKSFVSLDGADHLLSAKADSLYAARTIGTWAQRYVLQQSREQAQPLSTQGMQVVAHLDLEDNFTTQISNGQLTILADEPADVGGDQLGLTPYDLLNAALGACTNMTLKLYAERKKWPLEEVYTYLTHSKKHLEDSSGKSENLGKIDHIDKRIELKGDLSPEQRQRLLEIAAKCPVHRTLTNDLVIESTLMDEDQ
jgi:uncharacterized OsmC-like protein/pimeloyl-ACP methyl ester carboxylesterase